MHALSLGHPVMGDSLYGTEEGKAKSDRLLLHARVLSFNHVRPLNNRKGVSVLSLKRGRLFGPTPVST